MDLTPNPFDLAPRGPRLVASILGIPGTKDWDWKRAALAAVTGGASETTRAAMGKDSALDPVLNQVGLGIDPAGPPPDPNAVLGHGSATTDANLARAYQVMDAANQYQTGVKVRDPGVIAAPQVIAPKVEGPERTTAHDAGPVERVTAERVQGRDVAVPTLGEAARAYATEMSPAALARATTVGQAQDTSGSGELLEGAARGNAPSKAEALLRSGQDAAAKKAMSIAMGARGVDRSAARRAAVLNAGSEGAELANKAAALRADEMATARGQFAQHSQAAQSLKQQALNLQGQIDAARAQGDQAAVNALTMRQAEMYQRAAEFNAAATNARDVDRATLEAGIHTGNANREVGVAEGNAGRGLTAGLAGAAAANARAESLAQRSDESDEQYAARLQAWRESGANRDVTVQTTNAGNSLRGQESTAQFGQAADINNANIAQGDQRLRLEGQNIGLGAAGTAAGQQTNVDLAKLGIQQQTYNAAKDREEAQRDARRQMFYQAAGAAIGGPAGAKAAGAVAPKRTASGTAGSYDPSGVMRY
jgi:hypothetical protein